MKRLLWPAAMLLFPAGLIGAAMLVSEIRDEAGFFKPETIEQANKLIKEIKDRHKKDLVIETYKAVPDKRKDEYAKLGKDRFFEEWARERARALEADGIYLLICKEPAHLQAEVDMQTRKKTFTLQDREKIVRGLLERLRKKEFDDGLLEAVKFVDQTMGRNLR